MGGWMEGGGGGDEEQMKEGQRMKSDQDDERREERSGRCREQDARLDKFALIIRRPTYTLRSLLSLRHSPTLTAERGRIDGWGDERKERLSRGLEVNCGPRAQIKAFRFAVG